MYCLECVLLCRLKVPLLEWVGGKNMPVSSVLSAANKALRETVESLQTSLKQTTGGLRPLLAMAQQALRTKFTHAKVLPCTLA